MFDVGTIKLFEQLNLFGQLNKDSMFFQKNKRRNYKKNDNSFHIGQFLIGGFTTTQVR